ncbi:methyltransferase domain-containing protein, partial [uncultured Abiotrophia sp.]|uniref:tRNA1(Val) (adenine(37)-N6)-methyltransferase n=1 Tax=uncultured Abiotrophia sp. TaxID=316094 RepID=UPI0028DD326F
MTDATDLLKPGERLDYLAREKLSIIQNPDYFAFSVDAILLAHFAKVPRRQTARILDLCSGTGVIPFLLSAKTAGHIDAIELQEALVDMAQRSCQLNNLTDRLTFRQGDVKTMEAARPLYDVVTCNPPYFSVTNKQTQHHLTSHAIA